MRQRLIGHRPDIPQLVVRIWRLAQRHDHDERVTSPSAVRQRPCETFDELRAGLTAGRSRVTTHVRGALTGYSTPIPFGIRTKALFRTGAADSWIWHAALKGRQAATIRGYRRRIAP